MGLGSLIGGTIGSAVSSALKGNKKPSGGSAGKGSSSKPSKPSKPSWQQKAEANSEKWHTASPAEKEALHKENQQIYGEHGYTYVDGEWKPPANTAPSGGSSRPSGGSSGTSSGGSLGQQMTGGGSYPKFDIGDTVWDIAYKGNTDADYLQSLADMRLDKAQGTAGLGQFANDAEQTKMQAYINQLRKQQEEQQKGIDEYNSMMQQAANQQQAAIQAGVDSAVANLNAQKDSVGKLTAVNNAAAEKAYMQTLNPNGSLAENLAANGLLSTGLTESSQIQAGNAYQGALNDNATTQTEAIAEIERAITQAKLNGDLQGAQALANLLTQIAQKGYEHVQNIAQQDRWDREFGFNMGVTNGQMNGIYNGMPTLAAKELEMRRRELENQLKAGQITQEQFDKQWQIEYELAMEELRGKKLDNQYVESQM